MVMVVGALTTFTIVVMMLIWMIANAMGSPDTWNDKLSGTMKEHGFHFRRPTSRWQKFWLLSSCDSIFIRRMLGGKWEAYIHDIGTFHACITWHWVDKFHTDYKGLPLFRTEDYDRFNDQKR